MVRSLGVRIPRVNLVNTLTIYIYIYMWVGMRGKASCFYFACFFTVEVSYLLFFFYFFFSINC